MNKIRRKDLLKVSLRLTLLQSTWCEGEMQSIGLAFCLLPGLRRLYGSRDELNEALRRHHRPFNTHPFVAGVIAGAALKIEEERRTPEEMDLFLQSSMGPLAALGDPFFFGALPIFVAVAAALCAMYAGVWAGILSLLFLFNGIHIAVRLKGVFTGYREGYESLPHMARWLSPSHTRWAKTLAAAGAGAVLIAAVREFGAVDSLWVTVVIGVGGILMAFGLRKWRSSHYFLMPALVAIALCVEVLL
ncbi:MAG: PTS mannose/fructose/sorbose transporter family subunit IID [Proteobacteria bacterium]|nr:PTS mannose/fructose/sorbose transporter family subunit IID [Pseudomonadota bacterium]